MSALAATWALIGSGNVHAIPYVYNGGHSDIDVEYAGTGSFGLQYNFGINATAESGTIANQSLLPDQIDVRVPDTTPETTVPSNTSYGFLGATPGSTLWLLPQTATVGKPFFGFGTYDLNPDDWLSNVTWSLVAESGPGGGQVSLWQTTGFGTPNPLFTTSNGIDASDAFQQITGGHDHYNWGFTATGVYQVMIEVQATHIADVTHANPYIVSGSGVFTFLVGSSTPVPIAGDLNHDGIVNGQDLALVSSAWLHSGNLVVGDANNDGIVNGQDLALISSNWLATSAGVQGSGSSAVVPEPRGLVLALLAPMALWPQLRRNHRRRHQPWKSGQWDRRNANEA